METSMDSTYSFGDRIYQNSYLFSYTILPCWKNETGETLSIILVQEDK